MDIFVWPPDILEWNNVQHKCALGRSGIIQDKWEGDGATPEGIFHLRRVMYRADKVKISHTKLPTKEINTDDAWCDDPINHFYNSLIRLPFSANHEILWRQDNIYDVVIELGHNNDPVIPNKGSAIFIHVAKHNFEPTEGCIALELNILLKLISECDGNDHIHINRTQI